MKIKFCGYLNRTDSSILKLKLKDGFKFERGTKEEFMNLLRQFGVKKINTGKEIISIPYPSPSMRFFEDYPIFLEDENQFYYVTKLIELEGDDFSAMRPLIQEIKYYIQPVLRKMRLFKEGDICMPFGHFFDIESNEVKSFYRSGEDPNRFGPTFSLTAAEVYGLQEFMEKFEYPFQFDYLQRASEAFEQTYQINNLNMAYISLIIALEILLNIKEFRVGHHIPRNAAGLLESEQKEAVYSFFNFFFLYRLRCDIIHKGKQLLEKKFLIEARKAVRKCFKAILITRKDKKELIEELKQNWINLGISHSRRLLRKMSLEIYDKRLSRRELIG